MAVDIPCEQVLPEGEEGKNSEIKEGGRRILEFAGDEKVHTDGAGKRSGYSEYCGHGYSVKRREAADEEEVIAEGEQYRSEGAAGNKPERDVLSRLHEIYEDEGDTADIDPDGKENE